MHTQKHMTYTVWTKRSFYLGKCATEHVDHYVRLLNSISEKSSVIPIRRHTGLYLRTGQVTP